MLYVFVDIKLDATHFADTVRHNFEAGASLAIVSTIQFVATLQVCKLFIFFIFLSFFCFLLFFVLTHMMSLPHDLFRKGLQVYII